MRTKTNWIKIIYVTVLVVVSLIAVWWFLVQVAMASITEQIGSLIKSIIGRVAR